MNSRRDVLKIAIGVWAIPLLPGCGENTDYGEIFSIIAATLRAALGLYDAISDAGVRDASTDASRPDASQQDASGAEGGASTQNGIQAMGEATIKNQSSQSQSASLRFAPYLVIGGNRVPLPEVDAGVITFAPGEQKTIPLMLQIDARSAAIIGSASLGGVVKIGNASKDVVPVPVSMT